MTRRQTLIASTVIAALLRLPLLAAPLWYDENFTLQVARLPWAQLWPALTGDVHPPLWYLLEWTLYHALPGLPPVALRLPAYIISLACLPAIDRILPHVTASRRVQVGALALMASTPIQIYYASEGRMYSLLCLLVLLGVEFVLTRRPLPLFITVSALAYTHNWGLFYAVTLGVLALCRWRLSERLLLMAFPSAALAWLPWAYVLIGQMTAISGNYWITRVTPGQIAYQVYQQIFAFSLGLPTALIVTYAWILIGWWVSRRNLPLQVMAVLPVSLGVMVSLLYQPVMLFRAMIGVSPFILIILASPLEFVLTRRRALLAAIFIAPLFIMAYSVLYTSPARADKLAYLRAIAQNYQPGDVIATMDDTAMIDLLPYSPYPIYYITNCPSSLGALTHQTRAALGYKFSPMDALPARRVWVIAGRSPLMNTCQERFNAEHLTADPVYTEISQSELIYSALWLVEK